MSKVSVHTVRKAPTQTVPKDPQGSITGTGENNRATISVEHILCKIFVRNWFDASEDLQGHILGYAFAHLYHARKFH